MAHMPRAVVDKSIEIHYQSPNDMVSHLAATVATGVVDLECPSAPTLTGPINVIFHVPWLGRELRLTGRVTQSEPNGPNTSVRLQITDGPHDTCAQLFEFVGRFRTGALLEDARDAPADGGPALSAEQRIRAMSPSLRAMLAAKANAEERVILSRDADPRVIEFLLKNPSIAIEEVRRIASRLNLHQGHFAMLTRHPVWMNDELVRTALARNPRLPEFMAEQVLATMPTGVLKNLAESSNVTAATRRVAGRILQTRGIVVGVRRT